MELKGLFKFTLWLNLNLNALVLTLGIATFKYFSTAQRIRYGGYKGQVKSSQYHFIANTNSVHKRHINKKCYGVCKGQTKRD